MKILKIKECGDCPNHVEINDKYYCHHEKFARKGGRVFKKLHIDQPYPKWCPLPDYPKPKT